MFNGASGYRADDTVVTCDMARNATDCSAIQAALCSGQSRKRGHRRSECKNNDQFAHKNSY